ncbi:MAG: hypothetical protein JXM73_09050 [Anaerolineae bacterium]|nr:hypothetical protein [Anaerolineae bacterium]
MIGPIIAAVVATLVVLVVLYLVVVRPWHLRRGATPAEVQRALPGDDIVADPLFSYTQAITVRAPPAAVWPWLVQIGYKRAGWYSWDGIHRLMGIAGSVDDDRRSASRVIPELQQLAAGDVVELGPGMGLKVATLEPERALILHEEGASWLWYLEPADGGTTRFIVRYRQRPALGLASRLMFGFANEVGSLLMQPKTMRGIKERAEAATR